MYSTGYPSAEDHIPHRYPGLEVSAWPCSDLPARSLLSHPGHKKSQFPPLNGTGVLCPYFHKTSSCILGGWPFLVEWTSIDTFYSSLKAVLFCHARIGSATE